jgi:hypothetical protein
MTQLKDFTKEGFKVLTDKDKANTDSETTHFKKKK